MGCVLAIDQSTSGTKAILVNARGEIVRRATLPHKQHYPAPGRVEHDANEIYANTLKLIGEVGRGEIAAMAIANQRETTVVWDRKTGEPVCPAVVWQDVRAEGLCRSLFEHAERVLDKTGLLLSPYYPAAKLAAVLQEHPDVKRRAEAGELCAGTVDSYLLYRLTNGKTFATDVSNASRTQLMNLRTLAWDDELLDIFGIPESLLAERILPSDAAFGERDGAPIRCVLGDSHASLFGHGCHAQGMVKTSYGTGSSLMLNVGEAPVLSRHGLSASVGFGFQGRVCYVLEGNITCSADTLVWLKEELRLIDDIAEVEAIASSVPGTDGVTLVPAFSGLGAPYFDSNARAILCGMNRGTTRAHVVRAALLSIAHQNADVLDAMRKDTGLPVRALHADGGGSVNKLLMQAQADFAGCEVRCSPEKDLTALGAAYMAGLAAGLYLSFDGIGGRAPHAASYAPAMDADQVRVVREGWADAVRRAR